jgi:hypothetical protein
MTVCVGALCRDIKGTASAAVVVASDRMVTHGGITEFEHEIPKIVPLADRVVALTAGDGLRAARLTREVVACVPSGPVVVGDVAQLVATTYAEHRRQQVESELFTPRGVTMAQFYGGLQSQLLGQLVGMIDQQVITFNHGLSLLIAGVDDTGAHLYSVHNPGASVNDFRSIGFDAIGSGALHALQSLIGFGQAGVDPLHETVFSVYVAKRRAESAPGVGRFTDMVVITAEGAAVLDGPLLEQLDALYAELHRPLTEDLKGRLAKLQIIRAVESDAAS